MAAKDSAKRRNQAAKSDDFKSVARRLGRDDDKVRFEKRLARMVQAKAGKRHKK